jgi:hypothetical protein
MRNIFFKGENILVRWAILDKFDAAIPFDDLTDVIVLVSDQQGRVQQFSKLTGSVAGVSGQPNAFEFEITEGMTALFSAGQLKARFTYKLPSSFYASGTLIDIIEEGAQNNDFITLQE